MPHGPSRNSKTQSSTREQALESLIDRLRGQDMPEGIFKTNGRLEATRSRCLGKISRPVSDADSGRGRRGHGWTGRWHHLVARNRSPAARIPGAVVESETGDGVSCRVSSPNARATWILPKRIMSVESPWSEKGWMYAAGTGSAPQQIRVGRGSICFGRCVSVTKPIRNQGSRG